MLFHFHQRTPLDLATQYRREAVVAYLKRAADPNMLEVCETVPLRIVVVSSREIPTLTDTSQLPFVSHVRVPHVNIH